MPPPCGRHDLETSSPPSKHAISILRPIWALDETGSLGSFPAQCARAREIGWSHQADLILEFSDAASLNYMSQEITDANGTRRVFDHHRARLASEDRKWLLSRCLPKVYGDRLATETTITADIKVQNSNSAFDDMGMSRFLELGLHREGLVDKDGRPTKKGIILYLQDRQRRGLDLTSPFPQTAISCRLQRCPGMTCGISRQPLPHLAPPSLTW